MLKKLLSRPLWQYALVCLTGIIISIFLIPPEQTLGTGIRLIYFHGTWIWTGIALYVLAALAGLVATAIRSEKYHRTSAALGRAALLFFLTYLPMAMLVMKFFWNGFFFSEPRWSIPFSLTITSLFVQIGILFFNKRVLTSLANMSYGFILIYNMTLLQSVLHPDSPIFTSQSVIIRMAYAFLLVFVFCGGILVTIWMDRIAPGAPKLDKA